MNIDVGCGKWKKKGYIGVDKYDGEKVDIVAPSDNLPFDDNSVDNIFFSHVIEHLFEEDVPKTINELYRVLKPKGKLVVITPDFEKMLRMWLRGDDEYRSGIGLVKIFGWQNHPGQIHYTGFDKRRLRRVLNEAGFKVISINNAPAKAPREREQFPDGDIHAVVTK